MRWCAYSVSTILPPARVRSRMSTEGLLQAESTEIRDRDAVRDQQLDAKVERMNEAIAAEGLRWKAGATHRPHEL